MQLGGGSGGRGSIEVGEGGMGMTQGRHCMKVVKAVFSR